ncbi:hypothetical protein ACH5RR_026474 [Cinchona calisaya]|uniref:Pre-mRNA processing factor 4 (PRP4)-like domain-containing protein n=1 Tax=Cinchona calisaya TaxID=153742 RepID=A0ABD2Z5V4_9GENT
MRSSMSLSLELGNHDNVNEHGGPWRNPAMANAGTSGGVEYEISEGIRLVKGRQEKAMQELLMKRCAAALVVPTNNMAARARLCQLGEPITLFGEREMERWERGNKSWRKGIVDGGGDSGGGRSACSGGFGVGD